MEVGRGVGIEMEENGDQQGWGKGKRKSMTLAYAMS